MRDVPKGENQPVSEDNTSGDIFSNQQESSYGAAASLETPVSGELPPLEENASSNGDASSGEPPQPEPPPPFVEDPKRKYLLFGALIALLFVIVFFVFNLVKGKGTKPAIQEKTSLTYWGLWEEEEIFRPIIDEYQKSHPNITITYVRQDPKQYRERLQAAIERGDGPDIFRFHNTWVPMLVKSLAPVPKNIYTDADFEKIFYPVVSADLKIQGNYYGIPLTIDGLLLFYNEDILKSANVPVPTTWIDVQNAVPKLTVREKGKIVTAAIALGTAENIEHFSDVLGLMMMQNGAKLTNSLFSCTDAGSTTCSVEALTFYRKFAETPNNSWDETLDNSIIAFSGGKVAMVIVPSWQAHSIKTINPGLNFKTALVPQLPCDKVPCASVNWATYWVEGVSNRSKNQLPAFEFLKYLSQPATVQKLYQEEIKYRKLFGEPYALVELGKTLSENIYLAPLITAAPSMKSFYLASRTYDGDTGINTSLITYLKDAINSLSGGVSPETALKTADNGFKQVFSRFGITSAQ